MSNEPRPDWRGLTERIRGWQSAQFPGVTEEVGKWRTVNELAELGKKIARGAPIEEIYEEAADVIITMQHMRRIARFERWGLLEGIAEHVTEMVLANEVEAAFRGILCIFPSEEAAFAEVERKFAKNLKRKWDLRPDGSGQHQEPSPAEGKLQKVRVVLERIHDSHLAEASGLRQSVEVGLAILDGKEG